MSESSFRLPLIALRGLVAFPNAATTLDAGREKSINAVERASEGDRRILLAAQRDANVENPHQADLYQVGTLARIKQVMRLPDGAVRLFVEGIERVILTSVLDAGDVLFGEAFCVPVVREGLTDLESAVYMRQIRGRALRLIRVSGNPGQAELINLIKGEKDPVVLLDAGANVDCRPYHLFQFGLMGDAFARDILDYESPRVSILSIGEEEGKGNSQVKEAYELLKMARNLNFIGNAEGRDIFTGDVDVVICDGFVGNIVVKMSEGLAKAITHMIKGVFKSSVMGMMGGLLAKRSFAQFARTVDYAEYGGAPLLGLKGLAIVCHGRSSSKAMTSAIRMAGTFVRKKTLDRLAETIQENDELTRYSRAL